jgi:hypothetical protein
MTDPIENLLTRLEGVKNTGKGRWVAPCPAHNDKSPSLAIREGDDGRALVYCFAGCSTGEVLSAIGMEMGDLFPRQDRYNAPHGQPERRPFPAADVLRAIGFEALVVMTAGASLLSGQPFTEADRERLAIAVGRIQSGLEIAGVLHV